MLGKVGAVISNHCVPMERCGGGGTIDVKDEKEGCEEGNDGERKKVDEDMEEFVVLFDEWV